MRKVKPVSLDLVPDDLVIRVSKTLNTGRWQESWQMEIFTDSVGNHIVRCLEKAETLPLPEMSKQKIKRVLALHELPIESVSERDLAWREEMEKAEKLLWGIWNGKVNFDVVMAKLIDLADNALIYYEQLTEWIAGDKFEWAKMPSENKVVYTFDVVKLFWEGLDKIYLEEEYFDVAKKLLQLTMIWIKNYWSIVPVEIIPGLMQERLMWVEQNLE